MAAALELYGEQVVTPLLGGYDTRLGFRSAIEAAVAYLTSDRGTPPGCLLTRLRFAAAQLGPMTRAEVLRLEAQQLDAYRAWFDAALDRGEADQPVPTHLAAEYIDTQFATLLMLMANGVSASAVRRRTLLAFSVLMTSPAA